jgi:transcriptional regulator with XRE-family HTH domain
MQVSSTAKWKQPSDSGRFHAVMAARHPHDKEEIGNRLRITREAMGLSQVEIVRRLGGDATPQKWNNYERGRDLIPHETVVLLAQKLGWTADWTLWGNAQHLPNKLATDIERIAREEDRKRTNSRS